MAETDGVAEFLREDTDSGEAALQEFDHRRQRTTKAQAARKSSSSRKDMTPPAQEPLQAGAAIEVTSYRETEASHDSRKRVRARRGLPGLPLWFLFRRARVCSAKASPQLQ